MLNHATQKMKKMHARRHPNNLNLSNAAYSQLSPSITSATFLSPTVASRRGLLSPSPPPSPSLPSLIPRHGGKKQSPASHTRLVKRILIGCCGVAIILWLVIRQIYAHQQLQGVEVEDDEEWEMVGGSHLPEEPSALVVQDAKGKSKWTVSIPASYDFPLKPAMYTEVCHQAMELSKQLREGQASKGITRRMLGYYQEDKYFIDVGDAEAQGLLPPSKQSGRPKGFVDDVAIANKEYTGGMKVCERTLTYVMETADAGFGNTLMRMWLAYGLAQAENRTFFLDDTRWPYGKYSSYFTPPPTAGCLSPPKTHMVPCPHLAQHIVVSSATVTSHFGHQFTDEWEDPTKQYVQRQHKIFALVRAGYEALFKLRTDDADYVASRIKSLYEPIAAQGGLSIGIHVRRGDRHPLEFQYQKDYIPLSRYMDTARDLYIDRIENANTHPHPHKNKKPKKRSASAFSFSSSSSSAPLLPAAADSHTLFARHTPSKLVLASDDPTVYESGELGPNTVRAQDRIMLATKAALEAAAGKKNPWIDEITGWEGGFYRDVFFGLGQEIGNAGDISRLDNEHVPEQAMRLRELVGRAYLMDLAVLGGADTLVCTVSSLGCRLLAVMVGWERAMGKGDWVNVDGDFDWKGIIW